MTIINFDRSADAPRSEHSPTSHASEAPEFDGGVSIGMTSLASTINALFAVGLDLAAARSVAEAQTADRIDRAITDIDAVISTLRRAAIPTCRTEESVRTISPGGDDEVEHASPADVRAAGRVEIV